MSNITSLGFSPQHYIPFPDVGFAPDSWFDTEYMELDFGESVGRPNENALLHSQVLTPLFQAGWVVESVSSGGSDGVWKKVAKSTKTTTKESAENLKGSSNANVNQRGDSTAEQAGSSEAKTHIVNKFDLAKKASLRERAREGDVVGNLTSSSIGENEYSDKESRKENSSRETQSSEESVGEEVVENDGDPYWSAWCKLKLARRRLQADALLREMMNSLSSAYNEGREIDASRYDEIVDLYALMIANTEQDLAGLSLDVNSLKPLIDEILDYCKQALEDFKAQAGNIPEDWMQSRIDEINRKFDALISKARSQMISAGTYNGTIWTSVESGYERDRQLALNDLKDEMVTLKVDVYGKIANITAEVGQAILAAATRFAELQKLALSPIDLRNNLALKLLDFMATRENPYPSNTEISAIADRLGSIDGAVIKP